MKESWHWVLNEYLKSRKRVIAGFGLFMGVFLMVYGLYHLPLEPFVYSSELIAALSLVIGGRDFYRFYEKHRQISRLENNLLANCGEMPGPNDLLERDYQKLVKNLAESRTGLISQYDSRQTEMVDYYTLWAHQIKTPISAMGLLLQTETASERKKTYQQELFKIEQYVEMVLQYLRLESMSADLQLEAYPLSDIVRQAVRKYGVIFINKKIALDLEEIDCSVITDEKWLVFVLEQIISNGLKYTNQGKISIYLDPLKDQTLVIEDTGVGIREEDINRIFERGFTGYNGRMDKKSTGIGLYLCQQVLNRLSHAIAVDSRIGEGTRVRISFAAAPIEDVQDHLTEL